MKSASKSSLELNNIPLGSAEEEKLLTKTAFITHYGQLLINNEVAMNIPVHGSPKAIKDFLEKFDISLIPIYMNMAPKCWDHCHQDDITINCSMDSQQNFKVLGLTKIDHTSKYRDI